MQCQNMLTKHTIYHSNVFLPVYRSITLHGVCLRPWCLAAITVASDLIPVPVLTGHGVDCIRFRRSRGFHKTGRIPMITTMAVMHCHLCDYASGLMNHINQQRDHLPGGEGFPTFRHLTIWRSFRLKYIDVDSHAVR